MKFQNILYIALCFVLVLALASVDLTPDVRVNVNEELLEQAETNGLLNVQMPAGAQSAVSNGVEVDGVLAGEITFQLNDVIWVYRCAAVGADAASLPDISGADGEYAQQTETEVSYCSAMVFCNEGETGKIIWADAVPGVAYSLTMDSNASADTLRSIAAYMFTPLQGNS